MVELMLALAILTLCLHLLSKIIVATMGQAPGKRERAAAVEVGRTLLEDMHSVPLRDVFPLYNQDPADDPGGNGTAPGHLFAVPGLLPQDDDPDGFVGEIVLPAVSAPLRENVQDPVLGFPRDLSGDIWIDGEDHTLDYNVLPVLVRVEWKSRSGDRSIEMFAMLVNWEGEEQ